MSLVDNIPVLTPDAHPSSGAAAAAAAAAAAEPPVRQPSPSPALSNGLSLSLSPSPPCSDPIWDWVQRMAGVLCSRGGKNAPPRAPRSGALFEQEVAESFQQSLRSDSSKVDDPRAGLKGASGDGGGGGGGGEKLSRLTAARDLPGHV